MSLSGCGALLGVDFDAVGSGSGDAGIAESSTDDRASSPPAIGPTAPPAGTEAGPTPANPGGGDAGSGDCEDDLASACDGKCGALRVPRCERIIECGTCPAGESCGGGGPNVCGTARCVPNCTAKACGEPDGCGAVCTDGRCGEGARCEAGECVPPPEQGKVVLFGGRQIADQDTSPFLSDTWEWNGRSWTARTTATLPPARADAVMTTLGRKLVLFGGFNGEWLGDTWEWDGQTWTKRSVTIAPRPRASATMAAFRGKVVLFGGAGPGIVPLGGAVSFDDTWEWDGVAWTLKQPARSPTPRYGAVMAPLGDKLVLFGGRTVGPSGSGTTIAGDMWEWDGENWVERSPSPIPPPRTDAVMVTLGSKLVLFGGVRTLGRNDTWEWDGRVWTQQSPATSPSVRASPSAAPLGGRLVLFGGNQSASLAETWDWDGVNWWPRRPTSAPPGRAGAAMATLP